jgi:Tfp pilus assembly protein PilN
VRAVNLLPRDEARAKREAPALQTQLFIAIPLLAAVLIGAIWFFSAGNLPQKRQTLADLQAELAAIPAPKPTVAQDPAVRSQHEERVSALANALGGRISWDRILRHVSAVLPGDVWLTKLAATSAGASSTTPAPASTTTSTSTSSTPTATTPAPAAAAPSAATSVEIDGYTYSQDAVARFMARLGVVPDLANVTLRSSNRTPLGSRAVVQFSVVADIRASGSSA